MNRRGFLAAMAAGAVVTAEGLWMPGTKLISIPSRTILRHDFMLLDDTTVRYIGDDTKTATMKKFYSWLLNIENNQFMDGAKSSGRMVVLRNDCRIENPEHLVNGTLSQAAGNKHLLEQQRELWTCVDTLGEESLITDKVYYHDDRLALVIDWR